MEKEAQLPEQPPRARARASEEWTEAEWFQVWLRLARREYQRSPEPCEDY